MWHILTASLIATAGVYSQSTPVRPPPTRPNCDGIALTPDYHAQAAQCNAANSFTLPNGRFVDEYNRFCICAEVVQRTKRATCLGVQDLSGYSCNSDGTFNCRVFAWVPGGSFCLGVPVSFGPFPPFTSPPNCTLGFCEPACMRYSKELQQFQNVRNCPCMKAQNQQSISTCANFDRDVPSTFTCPLSANDNFVPQCNIDGSWMKFQTGYGGRWCVDSNGNQIGNISFNLIQAIRLFANVITYSDIHLYNAKKRQM